jgi:hypothetical protein
VVRHGDLPDVVEARGELHLARRAALQAELAAGPARELLDVAAVARGGRIAQVHHAREHIERLARATEAVATVQILRVASVLLHRIPLGVRRL